MYMYLSTQTIQLLLLLLYLHGSRSPGGTPLRKVQETREAASNDPAAIIAQALRKKFAHNVFQDSPGTVLAHGLLTPMIYMYI